MERVWEDREDVQRMFRVWLDHGEGRAGQEEVKRKRREEGKEGKEGKGGQEMKAALLCPFS
jgi:hypothetical protein